MSESLASFEIEREVVIKAAKALRSSDDDAAANNGSQQAATSRSPSIPLPHNFLDEDKLMNRALTTYGLLQQLGFTPEQAETALAGTSGPYELEDCISILVAQLKGEDLSAATERQQSTSDGKSSEESPTRDQSVPPEHPAYSFHRSIGSRGALPSQLKSGGSNGSKSGGEAAPAVHVDDAEVMALTQKLRSIMVTCAASLSTMEEELSAGQEGVGELDTLEKPSLAWATARLNQIKLDRLKGQQKKLLRSGAQSTAAFDINRLDSLSRRLGEVMRDAERGRDFNGELAADILRERRFHWEAAIKEHDELDSESGPKKNGKMAQGSDGTNQEAKTNGANNDPPSAPGDGTDGNDPDGDDTADMFGGLLDETTNEVVDESGVSIKIRSVPTAIKGGRTPRALLSEALRRSDASAQSRFEVVATGGRAYRSRLTVRWPGPLGKKSLQSYTDIYELTGEATESQSSADDLLATLALTCLERDRATHRSLPSAYREWWDEIERHRHLEESAADMELMRKVRAIAQPRLDEIAARRAQMHLDSRAPTGEASNASAPSKVDLGDLAQGAVAPLSDGASASQSSRFESVAQSSSYLKMLPQRQSLPIYKFRQHILDVLDHNQIFVLSGETGCGKSTQVPAYILEHCMSRGQACKIYCTEPRRISAISLAERVSQELGEAKGAVGGDSSLVGYSIRLDSHIGRDARLIYATSGILLRMLEGTSINEVTHIIIDEVHERSIESDFLLIILKTLVAHRKDLKIILMSATLDAERISAYCGGCPTVSVPGRTFPVQVQWLEDAVELTQYKLEDGSPYAQRDRKGRKANAPGNKANLQSTADMDDDLDEASSSADERNGDEGSASNSLRQRYDPKTIETLDRMDEFVINHDLILSIIERVCLSPDMEPFSAAILVFLPGIQDIRKLTDILLSHRVFGSTSFIVSPLHSTLSSEEQSAVFNIPPQGVRKIVVSTNIAETGVTIPDVTCVIDSGKHREMRFDEKRQTSRLVDCFVAKSNAKQRRGRAGRVQEGLCFHLFTKDRHDRRLADHPLPEMLRLSLQDLALKLKIMKIRIGNSIGDALSQALDPPLPANVQRAVSALIEVKALTTTEEITPLGRHLARIPLDVHMGKFLLIASLFKCLDAALTIAAALNSKSPFVTPFGRESEADSVKSSFRVGNSDFLTIANAFNSWRRAVGQKHHFVFCRKSFLSHQTLQQMEELRQQYMAFLLDTGFVRVDEATRRSIVNIRYRSGGHQVRLMETPAALDVNGNSIAVLHAALTAGLYPKLLAIDPRTYQIRTIGNNQPANTHPSSVNFRLRMGDLPRSVSHLVYFSIVQSRKLYARETAPVADAALVLLCGDADFRFSCNSIYIDRTKIRYRVGNSKEASDVFGNRKKSARDGDEDDNVAVGPGTDLLAIKWLREQLSKLINSSFRSPGKAWTQEQSDAFAVTLEALGAFANDQDKFQK